MAKGGGSARLRWPGADVLEGRLLLSHATSSAIAHAMAGTPAHVSSPTPAPRAEPEPGRSGLAPSDDAEGSLVDEDSTASENGAIIPLLSSGKSVGDLDEPADSTPAVLDSTRYLRAAGRDEPVAWGSSAGGSAEFSPPTRRRVAESPKVSESTPRPAERGQLERASSPSPAPGAVEPLPAPEGSDLLADFLPSDRAAFDRAIDGLLDGLEGLGVDISRGVEATSPASSPALWGLALAALEVTRRRLRHRSRGRAEGEPGPMRDPGDGFLAFRG